MSEYFRKYIKKSHYPRNPNHIKFKIQFKNTVFDGFKKRNWKETEEETDWDILWADRDWMHNIYDRIHLANNQKINHFRNHYELTRKDLLAKNIKQFKRELEREGKTEEAKCFDFLPLSFDLPKDYRMFVEEFKRNLGSVWIMKPRDRAQGKGIFLFKKLSDISEYSGVKKSEKVVTPESPADIYIVQKYINNPLLIGGKKFDIRIYVLVTDYSPLTVYLYRTGFARFTHQRYSGDIRNTFVHLTNVSIQKTSEHYDDKMGGKWDLRSLKLYMIAKYGIEKVNESFEQIEDMIIRSLQSIEKKMIHDKHCFELYGYDVLFDSELRPWMIEVNCSPSLTATTPNDYKLKIDLVDDTLSVLDIEKILSGSELQIGGYDLIYKGQRINVGGAKYGTRLGSMNNREKYMKNIAKGTAVRLAHQYAKDHPPTPANTNPPIASTTTNKK